MIDYIEDDQIPVFLINGFLEAGKTAFISYTFGDEYFSIDGNTLLIVCEEGEVAFRDRELRNDNIYMVCVEEQEKLTKEYLAELGSRYKAERVVIEYNGMWDPNVLEFPDRWILYQQITIMNGQTLSSYLSNMKSLFGPMLKNTELVIINRCDGKSESELLDWKRKLRPMLPGESAIVMEDREGEIDLQTLPEELPYDLEAEVIEVRPEDFGIWFYDMKELPERYRGKKVRFTACIRKSQRFAANCFVPGRMAMTCCEADMTFIGFLAHYRGLDAFKDQEWVKLTAVVDVKDLPEYGGEGPFLEVQEMLRTSEIREPVGF